MKRGKEMLTVCLAACILSIVPVSAASEAKEESTVTVSAKESVTAVPDKASIVLVVTTEGEDSQEVQKENSERTARVKEALEEKGVKEADIRTSSYYLSPKYDYSTDTVQIIGYTAENRLEITGQEIADIGRIISAGNEAGANGADSLNFYCSNYEELYLQALEAAVASADKKAATLAVAAGYTTVRASAISEGYQDTSMKYPDSGLMANSRGFTEEAMDEDDSFVPVYAGETEIEASVTVIYEMS